MTKIVPVEEAVRRIPDGACISICGAWMLIPDRTILAVWERFLREGHPKDLTAVFPICPGGVPSQPGIEHLACPGLLARVIGGSYPNAVDSPLRRMIRNNEVEAYNLPSGLLTQWLREIGAGRAGAFTRMGLGTFVDPRFQGGRMNYRTTTDLLSIVTVLEDEYLFLASSPIAVAVIRATTADEDGNLTMEKESATLTAYLQAAATRSSGGIVIAQVKRVARRDTLQPHSVKVPGALVDYVVVDPNQLQTAGMDYDPAISGEIRRPLQPQVEASPAERRVALRAAEEIQPGDHVVLGYGLAAVIPHLVLEQSRFEGVFFAVEQGQIGGLPLANFGFGSSLNPQVILDMGNQFDLFQGGCFDLAILSFLQIDAEGRVNVHHVAAKPHLSVGIGGFMDIAANARRIVFLGSFTAGGLQFEQRGNRLNIVREGKIQKFVKQVDQVSFDPKRSRVEEMICVTERAVLRWKNGTWAFDELTQGVDLERDILQQMEFSPLVPAVS